MPGTGHRLADPTGISADPPLRADALCPPFSDDAVIRAHIDGGITLADAVNFMVEKYGLVRTDRHGFDQQAQSPFLTALDILRARQATGLMASPTAGLLSREAR